ncbi:hypothetical protein OAH96_00695, partial [Candidatus Pelagibacter sp.]|nr:hypothetical protein [Candidatus Pelagibacter sp.]
MIKSIIKVLLITFLTLLIVIFYLSTFGIKTDKFNNQITSNILKINKKVNLSLSDVNYLLNPYNFTINIRTKNPQILLEGRSLDIKNIQTNVALKALINNQFSIDDLQITTKKIKLNDIISLARVFQNSPQLFILDKVIKNGFVTANINLSFDEKGKVKENYRIEGSIKRAKINIINQFKLKNLNFDFDINQNNYSLKKLDTKFDNIEITSPLIEIKHKKNSFFINGQILNDNRKFDIEELKPIFSNLSNDINLQEIEFSSKNNFSFNVNKKLKFNNLKVQSIIELNKLTVNEKNLKLKSYLPDF